MPYKKLICCGRSCKSRKIGLALVPACHYMHCRWAFVLTVRISTSLHRRSNELSSYLLLAALGFRNSSAAWKCVGSGQTGPVSSKARLLCVQCQTLTSDIFVQSDVLSFHSARIKGSLCASTVLLILPIDTGSLVSICWFWCR